MTRSQSIFNFEENRTREVLFYKERIFLSVETFVFVKIGRINVFLAKCRIFSELMENIHNGLRAYIRRDQDRKTK